MCRKPTRNRFGLRCYCYASNGENANEPMLKEYQTFSLSSASNSKHEPLLPAANSSANCDRTFLKAFPSTFSSAFFPSNFLPRHIQDWNSSLQTENASNSCLLNTCSQESAAQLCNASLPLLRTRWQRKKTKKRFSFITFHRINVFFIDFVLKWKVAIRSIWKRGK